MSGWDAVFEQVANALGHAVVQSLWQCAFVGAFAAAIAMCTRRASVRYCVWCLGMLVSAGWFVLTFAGGLRVERVVEVVGLAGGGVGGMGAVKRVAGADTAVLPSASVAEEAASAGFFEIVALLWVAGFAVVSVRYVMQWRAAQRLRTRGLVSARAEWQTLYEDVRRRVGVSRRVCLRVSERARCPMVVGVLAPVVVVPASVLTMLSAEQVRMVLAHELAHVRRYDHVVNMAQVLIETVLFYHPVIWWMSRQARVEREHCCDDAAVRMCGDAVAYARTLTELEEVRLQTRAVLGLQGGSLMKRILRLIDGSDSGHSIGNGRALLVLAAGALIAGAGYAHAALNRETPRDDMVAAIHAGVESGVLSVEQARRAYHEVVYPGSDFEQELEAELAGFRADRIAEGLSGEELEQRMDWFVGRIPFRIEERFRVRVLGMTEAESNLSVFKEELAEKVTAGELKQRDAVISYQSQLSFRLMKLAREMETSQRELGIQVEVGAITQEEADRRFSEMMEPHRGLIEILAAERRAGWKEEYGTRTTGSVHSPIGDMHDGIPVRLTEVDGEKKTYEFIGYPWEDGDEVVGLSGKVYKVGGRVSTTPGISVKPHDAKSQPKRLHDENNGAPLMLEGVDDKALDSRQKHEQGAFEYYERNQLMDYAAKVRGEVEAGRITEQEAQSLIQEETQRQRFIARWLSIDVMYQDQVNAGKLSAEDAKRLLAEARKVNGYHESAYGSKMTIDIVEPDRVLNVDAEPVGKEGKLTPMDDDYWIHQGIRPLEAYDESFLDDC